MKTLHVCQCRTMSPLRALQPVMGISTPHVHGGMTLGLVRVLQEGGDPDLVPILAL